MLAQPRVSPTSAGTSHSSQPSGFNPSTATGPAITAAARPKAAPRDQRGAEAEHHRRPRVEHRLRVERRHAGDPRQQRQHDVVEPRVIERDAGVARVLRRDAVARDLDRRRGVEPCVAPHPDERVQERHRHDRDRERHRRAGRRGREVAVARGLFRGGRLRPQRRDDPQPFGRGQRLRQGKPRRQRQRAGEPERERRQREAEQQPLRRRQPAPEVAAAGRRGGEQRDRDQHQRAEGLAHGRRVSSPARAAVRRARRRGCG